MLKKLFKNLKKSVSTIMAVVAVTLLSSCGGGDRVVQNGISIGNEALPDYSAQTVARSVGVVEDCLTAFYELQTSTGLTSAMKTTISQYSNAVVTAMAKGYVSEEEFEGFFAYLEDNLDVVNAFDNLRKGIGDSEDETKLKALCRQFTSTFGVEATGNVLYDLSIFYFDYNYETALRRYEQYGFNYLLKEAEEFAEKKNILETEVEKGNFIQLTKSAFFISELMLGGALNSTFASTFTSAELCVMLKQQGFSEISLNANGWSLVLEYLKILLPKDYGEDIFVLAKDSGDLLRVADVMNTAVKLLSAIQENLTPAHTEHLINYDADAFAYAVVSGFNDEEWAMLEGLEVALTGDYNAIALEYYGDDYLGFKSSLEGITISGLKQAADKEGFANLLYGYLKGLYPAFFYGVIL